MSRIRPFAFGIATSLLLSGLTHAQTISGRLVGTVMDPTGAVLQQATVVARNEATNAERSVRTDQQGRFLLINLEPGSYAVTVTAQGFKTSVFPNVTIQVATQHTLDVQLDPGGVTEVITVTTESAQVESATSELGAVVTGRVTRDLPLNGRDFAQLTRLVAGASTDSEGGAAAFVVNGQRSTSNNFMVDGTDVNDPLLQINASGASGTSAGFASVDAIQEFKVQTGSFSAEFGRFSGAVVNIITRSGTNEFHGSAFEFLRNDVLDANNFFNNAGGISRPPLRSNQFGGTLGGPVVKNKTFFFASYEGLRQSFGAISNGTVPSLLARELADPGIKPVLDQIVLPTGPDDISNPFIAKFTGVARASTSENNLTLRVDHKFTESDLFFARYSLGDGDRQFAGSALLRPPNVREQHPVRLQSGTISYTHVFSANVVGDFRFGFNRLADSVLETAEPLFGAQPAPAENGFPTLPVVIVSDLTLNNNIVGGSLAPSGNAFTTYQYVVNFSLTRGVHALKFGGDARRVHVNRYNEGDNGGKPGLILFPTTEDLINNSPLGFVNEVGILRRGFRFSNFSFYGQDDYRMSDALTLNLGLRYDLNTVLSEVNHLQANVTFAPDGRLQLTPLGDSLYEGDYNNFAPRFGFAYSPLRNGRLVLRGGIGLYYDLVTQIATNIVSNPPVTLTNTIFLPGPYPEFLPVLPDSPTGEPPLGAGTLIPAKTRTPYVYQYSLEVQAQLSAHTIGKAAFVGSRGVKLLRERILNFLLPFGPIPGPITSYRDDRFGIILINEASTQAVYNGLQLTLDRRFSRGFGLTASYTWSHSIDDASTLGLFGTEIFGARASSPLPSNPNDARAERGNSNFDVRHVFTLNSSWEIPFRGIFGMESAGGHNGFISAFLDGWSLNGIISLHSGQPFTITVGTDSAGLGDPTPFFSQRPNVVPSQPVTLGSRRGPDLQLNPAAFTVPAAATFGNLGRNTAVGPSFSQVDFSVFKTFALGERVSLQFRAEFFNLFNHPNFSLPAETANLNVAASSPVNFGVSGSTVNTQNQILGAVFAQGGPRSIQFGLKLNW